MRVKGKNGERITKSCIVCNEPFQVLTNAKAIKQKYCSMKCNTKDKRTLPDATCIQCGNIFRPKFIDRNKYCSKDCKHIYKANIRNARHNEIVIEKERLKIAKLEMLYTCKECVKPFKQKHHKRPSSYCSIKCMQTFAANKMFNINTVRKANNNDHVCKICGKHFNHPYGNKLRSYCSIECKEKDTGYWDKKFGYIRRMRFKSQYKEHVNKHSIFRRDEYTCQLCNTPLDMKATFPAYLSPTIDHITPLAKGGTHEPNNIQSAHFICNSYKGDRLSFDVQKIARYLKCKPTPYKHNPLRYSILPCPWNTSGNPHLHMVNAITALFG